MKTPKLYGIIGYPLGHSLSPALHNWAFSHTKHLGVFLPWAVLPQDLPSIIKAIRLLKIAGVCVTIPHKENVIPLLDSVSPEALAIGAVNTLYWQGEKLCGDNTDIYGFKLPLQDKALDMLTHACALVLGAGGAARAVLAGLQSLGVKNIFLCNHHNPKAEEMARVFHVQYLDWEKRDTINATCIINTTPLGMLGKNVDATPYPAKAFGRMDGQKCLAYDLVYNPLQTRFLREASSAGWKTQDGLAMFVGQALRQMDIWTGRMTNFQETRAFLENLFTDCP